ncbi:188b4486-813a-466d-bffc-5477357e3cfa [Thermothielavioides terrestris]|uniref:188b4486-813a-466d-bffc-5477357e3cfa n=1 Tax=Thermothielavioides terrestris TaxID=2587410 RepID=A0A446BPQ8_9PEZI|nr:188b4486-813a-466d-bffc-5477357e3cfa [Thermothielavioides terrestris]
MPPTLILIRHAQALHNVDKAYHSLRDPVLTDLGRLQAVELREHLKAALPPDRRIELIVISPMRRAIETCLIALDWVINEGVPVVPDARWQELHPNPCDTGTPREQLAADYPQIDFSLLDPVYPDKISPAGARYRCEKGAVLARAQSALADLYWRTEDVVAVVSHSGFMRTAVTGRRFANADYRVFDFEERDWNQEGEPYRMSDIEQDTDIGGSGILTRQSLREQIELII